ncbi:xylosyltransferase 2-like [Dorcoceras hygrometricum]|uniref:Xylosyltransferase 2-like n=1 Tax=Dorcoceras hygrometricum TaxID=472368 RepID=A0A2Z7CU50_9LAMI|nr:xylosyltransferase 2-like [Dorcoceras hygrometricum]
MISEAHSWEPRSTSNNSPIQLNRKLKQRLRLRSQQQFEVLPQRHNTRRRQQLRDLSLAKNSLQEWYRKEELHERSPTLPRTPKTTIGNDGKLPKKLTHSRCRYSDVCMAIESLTTLDIPMVVDSIGIYELKGSYYMLTMTDWFLQALSVIPMLLGALPWSDG